MKTLINTLSQNATLFPERIAYTFLGANKKNTLTNKELLHNVIDIASRLLVVTQPGSRCILLLPPGLEYIASFLACLMAGIVAVPAYPPRSNRHTQRILAIIDDAEAEIILTTTAIAQQYVFEKVQVIAIEDESHTPYSGGMPQVSLDDLAFLQYTSGSTGNPKGVMVSHGNIIANTTVIDTLFEGKIETVCSWLPPFHDMGLIGAILYPLAYNKHSVLMAPTTFLKNPFIWLKTISDYRANISPAPNFSYEMCVTSITDEQKKQLDLSNWLFALNGAEPVSAKTLARFSEAFKAYGFRAECCYPVYGMAETTLMVSGKKTASSTRILQVDKHSLQNEHQIQLNETGIDHLDLVGCGYASSEHEIKIIDPQTLTELKAFQIGEIVVSGPSVTQGYWNKPEISQQIFELKLLNSDKKYLRTGDLGFLDEYGELFITGRLKDLIIIRGHNIYPQDIESIVHDSHPALIQHGCAAFTLEIDEEPELVIVQEVHRRAKDHDEVFNAILQRCSEDLPLLPARIILIQQATLPKTSSGKVQRNATRQAVERNELKIIAQWQKASLDVKTQQIDLNPNELQRWMKQWFAKRLHLNPEAINSRANFAYYGVDSSLAVQFCGALEFKVQREVNPSLLWEHSTIEQLAYYLETDQDGRQAQVTQEMDKEHPIEPIAIIGMSCRFPGGANSPEAFWEFLKAGEDGITQVPPERWDSELYYAAQPGTQGKMVTSKGGFIDNIDRFDAALFNISRREAEAMDPQHRLLLELTWEALERAGIAPLSLDNSDTGIFIGISSNDYGQLAHNAVSNHADAYYGIGNAHSAAAGRIAYFLGTHGESIAVDTACSSSLVAVFNACQDLHEKTCDLAIVGGVNSILDPSLSVSFSQAGMLSPNGKCQVFDAKADGYVRSEGCGILILKRLSDAQRNKDNIIAVIQSAVVNSDGHSNGITAPSPKAQQDLICKALQMAGISPDAIDYVEAHGTGTRLGDPIEFNALKKVFATSTRQKDLYIGSVKSNIGHLEAAAGMAGLIKTVLMLQHRQIPPNLHFETVNPLINLASIPARVPKALHEWETGDGKKIRYAGVSSFGFTGTNAHLILAESPTADATITPTDAPQRPLHVFTLSGHTPEALAAQQTRLLEFIQDEDCVDLASLCHSLAIGRSTLDYRFAISVQTHGELIEKLRAAIISNESVGLNVGKTTFLFTGQGSQYSGMGWELYNSHPLFRKEVDHCSQLLADYLPEPLTTMMFSSEKAYLLNQTQYTQPALFILQYALAQLWMSWGIHPTAAIGHSVGEYVAATVAGVMSLADGLKLITARAKLMQAQQKGSMLAVNVEESQALALLHEFKACSPHAILNIAAVNSVSQVVFSGEEGVIRLLDQKCQLQGLRTTELQVSHAFHSELLRPMIAEFKQIAASIQYHAPKMVLISNVSGKAISAFNADYWAEHVLATVQFSAGIQELLLENYRTFIEIGPQPVLLNFAKEHSIQSQQILWLASLRKNQSNWQTLSESIAQLYKNGYAIDWHAYDAPFNLQISAKPLPPYPFQHQSYWLTVDPIAQENRVLDSFLSQSLYQVEWKPLAEAHNPVEPTSITGTWLIFANKDSESKNMVRHLSTYLRDVIVVNPGVKYQISRDTVTLNPYQPAHFLNFLSKHSEIRGVFYLWGLVGSEFFQEEQLKAAAYDDFNQLIRCSCAGLLHLVQALMHQKQKSKLWTLTRATTTIQHQSLPFFSPLVGMGKTLVLEYPELDYHHFDVDVGAKAEKTAQKLHQLISQPFQDEPVLAYQQGALYVPRIVTALLPRSIENKKTLRKNGSYLITGGLGGIGSILGKWLMHQEVSSIILLGRQPLTDKITERLNEFRVNDIAIQYLQADVSDYQKLRQVLTMAQNTMPPIKGIFHTAGTLSDGLWSHLTWQQFEEVFCAKVQGSFNLHCLSKELMPELEHFIMFSSISSLFGSPGQANYAAANTFLDNLAHYRAQAGLPALSINFGPWQEVGMTRNVVQSWLAYGIQNISEKVGLASLKRMLSSSFTQLCLMPNNIVSAMEHLPCSYKKLLVEILPATQENPTPISQVSNRQDQDFITRLKKAHQQQRLTDLTNLFINEVRIILRLKESDMLPMNANLLSLGMDSLLASELLHQLQRKLLLENLSIQSLLFENRSLEDLIYFLNEQIGDAENLEETTLLTKAARHLLQLSVQQIRIWRHIQDQPANPAYVVTNLFQLDGSVDVLILEKSIQQVIERHSMLRCSFHISMGTPFQFCHDQVDFKLHYFDFRTLEAKNQNKQINQLLKKISHHQFDLHKAPLLESYLIQYAEKQYVWAFSVSHLLTDGGSSLILFQDILHFYALNQNRSSQTLPAATPYEDFIDWQLANVVNGTYEKYVAFWHDTLLNYNPPVLPTDKAIPQQALAIGAKEPIHFSVELLNKLQDLTKKSQVTLPNLLFTAYGLLLAQFAQTDQAFITMLCAGRETEKYQTIMGNVANELPLIIHYSPVMSFIDIARQLQNSLVQFSEYQYLQPEQITEIGLPVPDVSFDFQHLEIKPVDPGFTLKPFAFDDANIPLWGSNPRKLSLKFTYNRTLLTGYLKYRVDLYDCKTIALLTKQFLTIIKEVVERPERTCSILTDLCGARL